MAWRLFVKLNPNPLADNLAQFPKARSLVIKQVQNSLWKVRDCKIVAENQSDAVVLNCWFLKPTMAGHSPVLTLQFLICCFHSFFFEPLSVTLPFAARFT